MSRRLTPILVAALLPVSAGAEGGESLDIELQRPSFGSASLPGLDHPAIERYRLTAGVLGVYLRDPLVLLVDEAETGAVVAQRHSLMLGAGYDVSRRVSLRGTLPVAWSWAGEEPRFSADGMGMGDPSIGLRVSTASRGAWTSALRADALLPIGRRDAWLGEGQPRALLGLVTAIDGDRFGVHADLDTLLRGSVETDSDLVLGHELSAGAALRYSTWPGRQDLFVGTLLRWPLLPVEGSLMSAEILLGSRVWPTPRLGFDLGVGRGLTDGYGTTEFRGWLGVQLAWRGVGRPEPVAPIDFAWTEPTAPAPELAPPREPIDWREGQLAQVHRSRIEIREPIQFEVDTDHILTESQPTLLAVAEILEATPQILHVVIEGHASAEGEHAYNYELSIQRARAIVRALIEAGVNPRRLSCRGMGEVAPVLPGTDEASLAASRRVLFLIAEQLDPLDPLPPEPDHVVPWAATASSGSDTP